MIEAMKQALEALKGYRRETNEAAITALRQAIEQAEKQEPVALQMDVIVVNLVREGINKHRARELAEHFIKHTTPQPRREWVGLTEDDRNEILINAAKHNWDDRLIVKQMETKLKERNGGNT